MRTRYRPNEDQRAAWQRWVHERPVHVRILALRFPPWNLYTLTTTGETVFVQEIQEHEDANPSLTVIAHPRFNRGRRKPRRYLRVPAEYLIGQSDIPKPVKT